ncbi:MAG: hypothetical protein K2G70_02080 [Turicibacter sp.]|nr:hypothetical protein [Turicibacter sp.]
MANVKFQDSTFYVPSDKFLIVVKEEADVYQNSSTSSKIIGRTQCNQVFSIASEVNNLLKTKIGWIKKSDCNILLQAPNEVKDVEEPFVVKVISNIPVFTEASTDSHATTVLRIGSLPRVVGESEDFYKLEHGGFIEKRGCRHY